MQKNSTRPAMEKIGGSEFGGGKFKDYSIQENPTHFHKPITETSSDSTVVDDDDDTNPVDTTLSLSIFPVPTNPRPPKRPPTAPFRLFGTTIHIPDENQTLSLRPPVSTISKAVRLCAQRRVAVARLMQSVGRRGGRGVVFLFRKKLEVLDQFRLVVTEKERVVEFLTKEEVQVVEGNENGMKMTAVDARGEVYHRMGLTKFYGSLMAINADWRKMVIQNNAKEGDAVEIWGYREGCKPCLAFNFIHIPPVTVRDHV